MKNKKAPLSEYRNMAFVQGQFVPLDALVTFVPIGSEDDLLIQEYSEKHGQSRWYPTEGGYNVYFPYEGEEYDAKRFRIEKGTWSHEHCDACGGTIDDSLLCWVTEKEPIVLICQKCHKKLKE